MQFNRPDLILLDVHMPGMDGFETIAAIRADSATANIPVIFLTADDDSSIVLKMLMNLLGKNYEFVPFSKGSRALEYLTQKQPEKPDLIMLDVEMPEINGYQLLMQIKKLYGDVNVPPVIFLTSNNSKDDVMKAVSYGAKDYAVKPIVEGVLLEKIQRILSDSLWG